MALSTTPTIAICLVAGVAAGIALARPGDEPAPVAAPATEAAEPASDEPIGDDLYAGLGDAAAEPSASAESAVVTIEGFAFAGQTSVAPGATIDVTNLDSAPHTLTADDGAFDTGTLARNEAGSITAPTTAGAYSFFCAIHPSMTGTLTVG